MIFRAASQILVASNSAGLLSSKHLASKLAKDAALSTDAVPLYGDTRAQLGSVTSSCHSVASPSHHSQISLSEHPLKEMAATTSRPKEWRSMVIFSIFSICVSPENAENHSPLAEKVFRQGWCWLDGYKFLPKTGCL